jgi:hypothetical protein
MYVSYAFVKCTYRTYSIYKPSASPGFPKYIMRILLFYATTVASSLERSYLNTKFKPLIFSMSGFALSCTANMFILMILYDFCLLPAQVC